jgi:glucosamine-6-phosphate deaminase
MERIKDAGLRVEKPEGLLKVSAGLRGKEKIFTEVFETSALASVAVAREISNAIRERQKEGKNIILGMATGSTPIPVYNELIRQHREEGLSFKNVITFNLDEYYGLEPTNEMSYHYYMHEKLFKHIDIPKENVNIPPGIFSSEEADKLAEEYEEKILKAGA